MLLGDLEVFLVKFAIYIVKANLCKMNSVPNQSMMY